MLIQLFKNDIDSLQPYIAKVSQIVLLQDGIYTLPTIKNNHALMNVPVAVVASDWVTSGLPETMLAKSKIRLIEDAEWVQLCIAHQPVVSVQ